MSKWACKTLIIRPYKKSRARVETAVFPSRQQYPDHFLGNCADCHTPISWEAYQFNHVGVTECESCHLTAVNTDHYAGTCDACHQDSISWQTINYTHTDNDESCTLCHREDTLNVAEGLSGRHYVGDCNDCHTTDDWTDITFNHTAFTQDCQDCHRLGNHYPQVHCESCHSIENWQDIV